MDAFHAKLAPIKCTPASLEADDGEEPVLLRASYYHSLPSSQRPAFSTYQQHAPEYMCVSGMKDRRMITVIGVIQRIPSLILRAVCLCRAESAAEASPPHTPGKLPSTDAVKDPEDVKQPNNSMAAASPAARTPPQAPRVRALKRLMQTKNRCCGECTPTWHHFCIDCGNDCCANSAKLCSAVVDPLLRALAGRHRRCHRPASWRGALYGPPWRRYSTSPAVC